MDETLLDNVFWACFTGPHAHLSDGTERARRYARGLPPIIAFADPAAPEFEAIRAFCAPGERFFVDGWTGARSPGFEVRLDGTMFKMVWDGECPATDECPEAIRLGESHTAQAYDLAMLTKPGPFDRRNLELGEYFGVFEGDRLAAMAGERTCAAGFREISAICTHPDFRGRGLSGRLTRKLIRREMQRGERPFLHVMSTNVTAVDVYRRLGFRVYRESPVRVVEAV